MSDTVPSDKPKAPVSDQSQQPLSDRQATAGEHTERQPPDREESRQHSSDRTATAERDTRGVGAGGGPPISLKNKPQNKSLENKSPEDQRKESRGEPIKEDI